ncbi:spermidine acetyltransferase [Pseudomonas protegens]|uniref:Spermidine acetyltransferase n=2 Tax=Pseudomonas TaxID=286 RepID=A0A2T6GH82_9PSED|nr:spermidine acetyltransferase [Pseudomonas protegens]
MLEGQSLLRGDTHMQMLYPSVTLTPVSTCDEEAQCCALQVRDEQSDFIASNAESLEQADQSPWCEPLAVRASHSGELVGFLMHALDPDDNGRWIYRLMVDRRYQGMGYGRAALRALLAYLRPLPGGPWVTLGVAPDNREARNLYASEGFLETGEVIDGELVMRLRLS